MATEEDTKPEAEEAENSVSDAPKPGAKKSTTSRTTLKRPTSKKVHVVSGQDTDEVLASRIMRNDKARKSLSVHHLQRRLAEWGFLEAVSDIDGYYGELTQRSLEAWQDATGAEHTDTPTHQQLRDLFEGDPNVTLVIDTVEI
jgi:peptidoglycan hydrolase-like protein with peptidoglycan-binding domain